MKGHFSFRPQQIEILQSPTDFHQWLIKRIQEAKERVVLASLYLGTDEHAGAVIEALKARHQTRPQLTSHILLDYFRGTRGLGQQQSSIDALSPVLPFTTLSLYKSPFFTRWHDMILSERWNEIIGLQHMKVYVIDDSVLLSGANLSDTYFTNRQDRYIVFRDHRAFADYCTTMVTHIGYKLAHTRPPSILYERDPLQQFQPPHPSAQFTPPAIPEPTEEKAPVRVTPLLELPPLGIHQETAWLDQIFLRQWQASKVYLCSGYLNLRQTLQLALATQPGALHFMCAHPTANGFFGARGASKWIPDIYRRYTAHIRAAFPQSHLLEWQKPGWTFHGKGMWLYDADHKPSVMSIGSSNFNPRSTKRDLEFGVLLEMDASQLGVPSLQEAVDANRRALFADGEPFAPPKMPFWKTAGLDVLSRLVKSYF